jgi:hypothetical protein
MARRTTNLRRLSRDAAAVLALCTAAIVGTSLFVLLSGVWKEDPEPGKFYAALPDVDVSGVPPATVPALLKKLNVERCTCGCGRTVAGCRNEHGSCELSKATARAAVMAAKK